MSTTKKCLPLNQQKTWNNGVFELMSVPRCILGADEVKVGNMTSMEAKVYFMQTDRNSYKMLTRIRESKLKALENKVAQVERENAEMRKALALTKKVKKIKKIKKKSK